MTIVNADFPVKLEPIFQPKRYKILYGGRGGAKSWGIARALLIMGTQRPLRILCARELQKSIKTSVHQVLSDQIKLLHLQSHYQVLDAVIKGTNGTEVYFEGLRHNAGQIKSYEGADICWVEEAAVVSKSSWKFLIPTIRKENSEIWISFNPELEEDETYQRFILNPPTDSIIIKISWRDNPWFSNTLRQEMLDDKKRDYQNYLHVWEGFCKQAVEGAIFNDEMQAVHDEGRLTSVPYNPAKPVNTFWDLGHGDQTAIWFMQKIGFEYHAIHFYQNARKKIQHYVKYMDKLPYTYGTDYLPHDGNNQYLVGNSVKQTMRELGRRVEVVPRCAHKSDSLAATRTAFPMVYFDRDGCSDGLQCLRRYKYKVDEDTGITSKNPLHDTYSNGADAFQTLATAPHIQWDAYEVASGRADQPQCVDDDYNPLAEA